MYFERKDLHEILFQVIVFHNCQNAKKISNIQAQTYINTILVTYI